MPVDAGNNRAPSNFQFFKRLTERPVARAAPMEFSATRVVYGRTTDRQIHLAETCDPKICHEKAHQLSASMNRSQPGLYALPANEPPFN
jgi:hypothetical protein